MTRMVGAVPIPSSRSTGLGLSFSTLIVYVPAWLTPTLLSRASTARLALPRTSWVAPAFGPLPLRLAALAL